MNKTKTNTMQLNKQRLQLWLSGKVAAYNNGSSQDIAMIKELCRHTLWANPPAGDARFYMRLEQTWVSAVTVDEFGGVPHHPVSWFFEADPIDQRLEALEKAVEEIRALINNKK